MDVSDGFKKNPVFIWIFGICLTLQSPAVPLGAIQVLRNADGGGGCQIFWKKALRRCKVQHY